MRILMASHGYPPTISGVTLVVQKLARAMVAKGHAVTVVTASERGDPYRDNDQGVQLVRVRSRDNPFWKEGPIPFIGWDDLEDLAEAFQPDILHTHEAAILAWQFLRLSRRRGLPLVASCHYVPRFVAQYLGGELTEDWVEPIAWGYSIWLLNQCDHVVFPNPIHRQQFLERGLTVPSSIISNGMDIVRYCPADGRDEVVEARYQLPPRPRILFVGRLARDKEIDVLIHALAHLLRQMEAHLLLVGRGDDRKRLEELVKDLGLGPWVHFLGFVPEEDMPALYRSVDLFAIASTCEVQSLPTLQALATGKPVVAVNALALPELVRDGLNGFLVPPGEAEAMAEAMARILRDPELAERMGRAGLAIAQHHAQEHTFDRYEALYQQLVRARERREERQ
jgi:1,2-diacylglycerol 3-alpha-glucosyltransferase